MTDQTDIDDQAAPSGDAVSGVVAAKISHLLANHDVSPRQQATFLAELCNLSFSQARRKLRGAAWSFGEVLAVVRRFGASLDYVFADVTPGVMPSPSGLEPTAPRPLVEATLCLGEWHGPCSLQVGALAPGRVPKLALIASLQQGKWLVGTKSDLSREGVPGPYYYAEQIVLSPASDKPPIRVAVLDDEIGITETLCEWFDAIGYQASPYTSAAEFKAVPLTEYDAFVVDFMLAGGESSAQVIADIRRAAPSAPILLLTGKLRDGRASEAELATVLRTANARFFEKPVRPAVLAAAIESALEQATRNKVV